VFHSINIYFSVNPYSRIALQYIQMILTHHLGINYSRNIKIGGPPAFFWQRDKLFETNYKCSPAIKLQSGRDRAVSCQTAERNSLRYVSLFHFQKSLSSLPSVCRMQEELQGSTITGTHLSVLPTQTVPDGRYKTSTNTWRQFPEKNHA